MGKKEIGTHVEDGNHDDDIRGNVDTQDLFKEKHGEESDIDMNTNDSRGQKDKSLKVRTVLNFDCSLNLVLIMTTDAPVFCESSLVYANPATGCRLVYDPGGDRFEIWTKDFENMKQTKTRK